MTSDRILRLGVLHGDGIGPEIVPAAVRVVDAAAAAIGSPAPRWQELPMGHRALQEEGEPLSEATLEVLAGLDGWVLGPHDSASYPPPHRSRLNPSGRIRKHFDLFANVRPARALPGGDPVVPGTDLVIVRENTEGFYADRNTFAGTGEMMPTPDVAIAHGIVTRAGTERIAHEAFRLARTRRRHVTVVHKANVLPLTTGLFRDVVREVGLSYPDVQLDDLHVDAAAARLVRRADEFDVIVTENMFGDVLSDLAGEVAGSLGTASSINCSRSRAMAQAAHGSAPDIAGRDLANPTAVILSTAALLRWLAAHHADAASARTADRVEAAVLRTIATGTSTPDLGGRSGTAAFVEAVVTATREP
ncbi:isocitrate/isopropylmalate dehydrogenase family protein [Kineococcus sp. SYSU DK002]|uniref:isocitrate/isopropylmalate dehydrogenase family protein n=1 Tax=Kineococcus sp. SYSU DK002 TaxID=3383123 RepID=UPI003D7EA6AF